jgi:outer membrane protein TolC
VLDAQRTLLAARQGLVRTERRLLSDLVQLAKALGGGWTELPPDPFQRRLIEPFVPEEGRKHAASAD